MALSELLSRVNFSYGNTSSGTPLSESDPGDLAYGAEQGDSSYDAPPPHEELDLPPSYPLSFSDAYKQWITSVEAGVTIVDVEKEYEEMERELNGLKKELKVLKERSAEDFARLHEKKKRLSISRFIKGQTMKRKLSTDRKALIPSPVTRSSSADDATAGEGFDPLSGASQTAGASQDSRQALQLAFETSHAAEMQQTTKVNEAESRADEVRNRRDTISALASSEEETWLQLKHVAESRPFTCVHPSRIGAALEDLNATDTAFGLIQREKSNLIRARLTVQHAHRYFMQALKLCDDLHGGPPTPLPESDAPSPADPQVRRGMGKLELSVKLSRPANGMFGRFGATMKVLDYQDAVRLASMAQTCLTECIRVLEPQAESIPEGQIKEDFATLKRDGVLQMVKVYNLVFGGRMIDSGVEELIGKMLRQQETAFACLTRVAVWVQSRVPECEGVERDGRTRRQQARKSMALVWKEEFREHC